MSLRTYFGFTLLLMHVLTTLAGMPRPCYMTLIAVLAPSRLSRENAWKGKATSPCELMPCSNSIIVFAKPKRNSVCSLNDSLPVSAL